MLTIFVSAAFISGFLMKSYADGQVIQPGSPDDPIITKSYFDQQVGQKVDDAVSKLQTITDLKQSVDTEISKLKQDVQTQLQQGKSGVQIVVLKPGDTLLAAEGTTLIVRTGQTVAVSTTSDGIPDVTAGKDITPNMPIETNHLLMFPREGRGIKPAPKNTGDIYVMVQGSYTIQNQASTSK
ncbi:MAG: hypothetical protein A2189_06455 [Paenibacillus sp. RIFOXYA1_FULL_44_5]|nr:MAG: hypothetical protein A2189_06455 [Paenibacillus sp. RIFOXYA1_FULL_44_5]